MNYLSRQKLREMIARYGESLCDEPLRCEGLLRDLCGQERGAVNVLVNALREGVANELRSHSVSAPLELTLARLTKRLREHQGLSEDIARWAVESWAIALGMIPEGGSNAEQEGAALPEVGATSEGAAEQAHSGPYSATGNSGKPGPVPSDPAITRHSKGRVTAMLGIAAAAALLILVAFWAFTNASRKPVEQRSRIVINSVPENATVWLAETKEGTTPMMVDNVAPGVHHLRLELEGHESAHLMVNVNPGETRSLETIHLIPVTLAPPPSAVPSPTPLSAIAKDSNDNGDAEFALAEAKRLSEGLRPGPGGAIDWYRRAAEKGHAVAQHRLGVFYATGDGVPLNEEEAVAWYEKAARNGLAEAQYDLAVRCVLGRGTPKDERAGIEWYRQAARQGYQAALKALKQRNLILDEHGALVRDESKR